MDIKKIKKHISKLKLLGLKAHLDFRKVNGSKQVGLIIEDCRGLDKLILPDGISYVGHNSEWLLGDNSILEHIRLPENDIEILPGTFCKYRKLREIENLSYVNSIGKNGFGYSGLKKSLEFGNGLSKLGYAAFGWTEIKSCNFNGASIETIEHSTFERCKKLEPFTNIKGTIKIGK